MIDIKWTESKASRALYSPDWRMPATLEVVQAPAPAASAIWGTRGGAGIWLWTVKWGFDMRSGPAHSFEEAQELAVKNCELLFAELDERWKKTELPRLDIVTGVQAGDGGFQTAEEAAAIAVDNHDFSVRTANALEQAGIKTFKQLTYLTRATLATWKTDAGVLRFNEKSIKEIETAMAERGLKLRGLRGTRRTFKTKRDKAKREPRAAVPGKRERKSSRKG